MSDAPDPSSDPRSDNRSDDGAGDAGEKQRARRFGWTSLFVWILFGLVLEAAHGFKLSAYLDDSLRRSLLRLAHAHGVILALVVLAHGEAGAERLAAQSGSASARRVGRLLRAAALAIPIGFASSSVGAGESDPSLPILLVPLGALLLLAAVGRTAWAAWRRPKVEPPTS